MKLVLYKIENNCVAVKIWAPDYESEPAGLFNKELCPDAPSHWFAEEPKYAAELYAMELYLNPAGKRLPETRIIKVLDNHGTYHEFNTKTECRDSLRAHVKHLISYK